MTVIDMETRQPTDRSVSFNERVVEEFIDYCNRMGYSACVQLIDENGQQMYIGMHAYSDDMLGMLEVCQSKINRHMSQSGTDDDEETLDGDA